MLAKVKKHWIAILVLLLVVIDQIAKGVVIEFLKEESIVLIPNILTLKIVKNTGGAFGVGEGNVTMFVLTNFVVLGIIIRFLITQKEQMDRKTQIVLSMILVGGFSNLIDRLARGFVVDYITIGNFPVFNIADCFIVMGWVAFCFLIAKYTWGEIKKGKKSTQ